MMDKIGSGLAITGVPSIPTEYGSAAKLFSRLMRKKGFLVSEKDAQTIMFDFGVSGKGFFKVVPRKGMDGVWVENLIAELVSNGFRISREDER